MFIYFFLAKDRKTASRPPRASVSFPPHHLFLLCSTRTTVKQKQAIKQPWLRRRKAKRKFVVLLQGIGCVAALGRWSRDLGSAGSCAGGGSRIPEAYPIGSAFQPLGRGRRPTVPAHCPPDNPNSIVRGCSYRLDLCVGCGRKRRVVGRAGQAPASSHLPFADR